MSDNDNIAQYRVILSLAKLIDSIKIIIVANCGIPNSPQNGYIQHYVSTSEGAEVNITCPGPQKQTYFTSICNREGTWFPDTADLCPNLTGKPMADIIISSVINNPYSETLLGSISR
jgi:hypothetical protein